MIDELELRVRDELQLGVRDELELRVRDELQLRVTDELQLRSSCRSCTHANLPPARRADSESMRERMQSSRVLPAARRA